MSEEQQRVSEGKAGDEMEDKVLEGLTTLGELERYLSEMGAVGVLSREVK